MLLNVPPVVCPGVHVTWDHLWASLILFSVSTLAGFILFGRGVTYALARFLLILEAAQVATYKSFVPACKSWLRAVVHHLQTLEIGSNGKEATID